MEDFEGKVVVEEAGWGAGNERCLEFWAKGQFTAGLAGLEVDATAGGEWSQEGGGGENGARGASFARRRLRRSHRSGCTQAGSTTRWSGGVEGRFGS